MLLYLYTIEYQIHYIISPFNPLADIITHDPPDIGHLQPFQGMMEHEGGNVRVRHAEYTLLHAIVQYSLYDLHFPKVEALTYLLHPPYITEEGSPQRTVPKHQRLYR